MRNGVNSHPVEAPTKVEPWVRRQPVTARTQPPHYWWLSSLFSAVVLLSFAQYVSAQLSSLQLSSALAQVATLVPLISVVVIAGLWWASRGLRYTRVQVVVIAMLGLLPAAGLVTTLVRSTYTDLWLLALVASFAALAACLGLLGSQGHRWRSSMLLALLFAAFGAAVVALFVDPVEAGARLTLAGRVRILANIVGPGIAVVLALLLMRLAAVPNEQVPVPKPLSSLPVLAIALLILLYTLSLTASRGVLLAITVSALASTGVLALAGNLRTQASARRTSTRGQATRRPSRGSGLSSLALATAVLMATAAILNYYSNEHDGGTTTTASRSVSLAGSIERLSLPVSEDGRWAIWHDVLGSLQGISLWFGSGTNSFPRISGRMYAHSVYIDAYVSFGVLGILLLVACLAVLATVLLSKRDVVGVALLTYLLVSYSTHGSLLSGSFWLLLGVLLGRVDLKDGSERTEVAHSAIATRHEHAGFGAAQERLRRAVGSGVPGKQ